MRLHAQRDSVFCPWQAWICSSCVPISVMNPSHYVKASSRVALEIRYFVILFFRTLPRSIAWFHAGQSVGQCTQACPSNVMEMSQNVKLLSSSLGLLRQACAIGHCCYLLLGVVEL